MLCVELPKKNVSFKKGKNGVKYVYLAVRRYRNKNGVPTAKEVSIGKLDNATGYLIPNKNFASYFPEAKYFEVEQSNSKVINIYSCGVPLTYCQIAQKLDLIKLLQECFPKDYEQIIHLAGYIAFAGQVLHDYEAWSQEQDFAQKYKLSLSKINRFLANLEQEAQLEFLYLWQNHQSKPQSELLYLDLRSFIADEDHYSCSTLSYDCDFASQIHLGVLYDPNLNLPLSYTRYSASLVDKLVLNFNLNLYPSLGEKNHPLVFAQKFFTKQNFNLLRDKKCTFVTSLPRESNLFQESLRQALKEEWDIFALDPETNLLQREFYTEYEGEKVKLFIYKNRDKARIEEDLIYEKVLLQQKELAYIQQSQKIHWQKSQSLDLEQNDDFALLYKVNHEQIRTSLKQAGHFILISNDLSLNGKKALEAYREREIIEKFYVNLINAHDWHRLESKQDQTTKGKLFVAFIAMIIQLEVRNKLSSNPLTQDLSFKESKEELAKVRYLKINSQIEQISLTKRQRDIATALEINLEINKS